MSITAARRTRASPYKGLASYDTDDAAFFFGRERERDVVIANLRAHALTVLYGASGVGKSSLLQAGVLSKLREEAVETLQHRETPEFVPVTFSSWGDDPTDGILSAIREAVEDLVPGRTLPDRPGQSLSEVLLAWAREFETEFFVILDEFEDYFLYHQDAGQGSFAQGFAEAVIRPDLPASFLLSVRDDAFAKLDRFKTLVPNLLDNYLRVRHLDDRATRVAIIGPIDAWNEAAPEEEDVSIDEALVQAVIEEVKEGAAAVRPGGRELDLNGDSPDDRQVEAPYLQLVLTRLWDEEAAAGSRRLRAETLTRIGGAQDIVREHLDQAMTSLGPGDQDVAAAVFHYLVTPEGTKIAQSVKTLSVYSGRSEDDVEHVLDRLSTEEARIVRPIPPPKGEVGGTRYEIFHNVLASVVLDWRERHERTRLEREKAEAERRHRAMLAAAEGRRRRLLAAVALGALVLGLTLHATNALRSVELETVDARYAIRGEHAVPNDLAIVAMDDRTFSDLGVQYPFPRSLHGQVIDRLRRAGARLIVYDIEFRGRSTPREDRALLDALDRARPVIVGATATDASGQPDFLGNPGYLRQVGARPASALIPPSGTVRKFPYTANGLKSIGVVSAESLAGHRIPPDELAGDDDMWIDYVGPTGTVPAVSFSRVLEGQFPLTRSATRWSSSAQPLSYFRTATSCRSARSRCLAPSCRPMRSTPGGSLRR